MWVIVSPSIPWFSRCAEVEPFCRRRFDVAPDRNKHRELADEQRMAWMTELGNRDLSWYNRWHYRDKFQAPGKFVFLLFRLKLQSSKCLTPLLWVDINLEWERKFGVRFFVKCGILFLCCLHCLLEDVLRICILPNREFDEKFIIGRRKSQI